MPYLFPDLALPTHAQSRSVVSDGSYQWRFRSSLLRLFRFDGAGGAVSIEFREFIDFFNGGRIVASLFTIYTGPDR